MKHFYLVLLLIPTDASGMFWNKSLVFFQARSIVEEVVEDFLDSHFASFKSAISTQQRLLDLFTSNDFSITWSILIQSSCSLQWLARGRRVFRGKTTSGAEVGASCDSSHGRTRFASSKLFPIRPSSFQFNCFHFVVRSRKRLGLRVMSSKNTNMSTSTLKIAATCLSCVKER